MYYLFDKNRRTSSLNPKRHLLLYLSRLLFFRAETAWLYSFKPCARFIRPFFKNRTRGYVAALRNRALGPTKNWPKTDFQWKLHTNRVFFFVFRMHFHYVLSYLFGLFGVRTCVSILWHTSLPKNATFAWKNSKKPWFWRFVIFVFLTWSHLWRHCDVIQGMFVLFWYQWIREGHSYPLVPNTWCFVNRFPRSWWRNPPPSAVRWVQKARLF